MSSNSVVAPKQMKFGCYLACLIALLLTLLPAHLYRMGLFILLIFAPLAAVRRLSGELQMVGRHLVWALLALGLAVGLLVSREGLVCAACFCLSLLFWSAYLCYGACTCQNMKLRDICQLAIAACLCDPWDFFVPGAMSSEERKRQSAKWTFVLYILAAMLVLLLLLVIQADGRIDGILRIFVSYAMEKAPLLISCLVLALFPAAIIYSFLSKLKDMSTLYSKASQPVDTSLLSSLVTLLWPKLSILLTVVNWLFLLVEIYYSVCQRTALPPQDNLYDVLAIILLIFIGLAAICGQIRFLRREYQKLCIALGVSIFGLIVFAGYKLLVHIMYFGLWNGQAVLSVILLSYVLVLCFMLAFSSWDPDVFFRKMGVVIAVFLVLVNMIPSGVVLTEVNASIFLYKYHALQLDGQRDSDTGKPVELTNHDLRLDLMESYGVNGIPALISLVGIEDVTVNGQTLGLHIRGAILDCLCADLGLSRTRDDQYDIKAVFDASNNIPRYRLPTSYAWALDRLKGVESAFYTSASAEE